MNAQSKKQLSVSLLTLPETTPATLYGLYEVLASIGVLWPAMMGEGRAEPRFDVKIISADGKPYDSVVGLPIVPQAKLSDVANTDIIVVTDLLLNAEADPREAWPEICEWLKTQYGQGATICSVCTGAVLLAAAGLLDGKEATTHWWARQLFDEFFPEVKLKAERIIVPAGDEHRIITSGGVYSWEDLSLYLIARFCGGEEAVRTAKIFLFGDRSEGQMPYAACLRPKRHEDATIAHVQVWAADNYAKANCVAHMTVRSGIPERTFKRRFKAATGFAPIDYVQTLRIEEAKQMLETTSEPADEIARMVGYDDPTFFRRLFKRRTGTTPARYRQRFRSLIRPSLMS